MVSCKHCQTPNSLDSTFCKRCGAAISESELVEAQAKMEKLIEEGNALFNQGRTDEAIAIAEAAVLSNPSSTSAWSLKTLCHERRGEIAEALECADRLVELNPDSDFDKIRRATLRQKLQTDLAVPQNPDRRLATLGAVSAVVLVLCIGAIVARMNSGSATASKSGVSDPIANTSVLNPVVSTPQVSSSVPNPNAGATANPNSVNSNPIQQNPAPATQSDPNEVPPLRQQQPRNDYRTELPRTSGDQLPAPFGQGTEIVPIQPDVSNLPPTTNQRNTEPVLPKKNSSSGQDPDDPTPIGGGSGAPIAVPTPPRSDRPEDNGIIITVHKSGNGGGGSTPGGGEPTPTTNGLEALLRVGNQQYQLGNYGGAVKSYEQAMQSGGDPIVLNRRLALAYEKLGRRSDAADSYRKCITAVDAALASGRGNRDSLNSTKDVCEQALKVLQGG